MGHLILLVGPDAEMRGRLAQLLRGAGHGVELAESGAHARRIGLRGFPLAVLAMEGLGADAGRLISELGDQGIEPLVVSSGNRNQVVGPHAISPSDEAGLLARVASAISKPRAAPGIIEAASVIRFGRYALDLAGHTLTDDLGTEVELTRREFNLLCQFVRQPGRVLSRDQLLNAVAGRDAESFDRSIDMLVMRLRRKIEPDPKTPSLIVTVPGFGYKFTAEVGAATAPEQTGITPVRRPECSPAPELRHITVLQCALAGPGFAAALGDPEGLSVLLSEFHNACRRILAHCGGTVVQLQNDGALAYFGYPQADEHQAERAVRAALGLIAATTTIKAEGAAGHLQARAGVASGLVVVGALLGRHGEPAAIGEAASLATALASHADADSVLISAGTRPLIGRLFHCRQHEPAELSGSAEWVETWQVISEAVTANRYKALRGRTQTALVGRQEELALLQRRWTQARAGAGTTILLAGEPGIGKSRLAAALLDRVAAEPHIGLQYYCAPHHTGSSWYPLIVQIEQAARIRAYTEPDQKIAKLSRLLSAVAPSEEDIAVLASLLSIPHEARHSLPEVSPLRQKQRTFNVLLKLLAATAEGAPLLVTVEDVQWADPVSREFLEWLAIQVRELRVLLLITCRSGFQAPWIEQSAVSVLALDRLDRDQSATLVQQIAGGRTLSGDLVAEIIQRGDGVPLFVEELTKAVLDRPQSERSAPYADRSRPVLPPALQAPFLARLDGLGATAKAIAQTGAVIGREFSYQLLAAVAQRSETELREGLDRLVSAKLLFQCGSPPQASYTFKHALIQDAAYHALMRSRRAVLHGRVADTLLRRNPEILQADPGILAYHCENAGRLRDAAMFYVGAGRQSEGHGSSAGARKQIERALRLISACPPGPERDHDELSALLHLDFSGRVGELGGPYVERISTRATELCERLNRLPEFLLQAFTACCTFHDRGEPERAWELADRVLQVSCARGDTTGHMVAQLIAGGTAMKLGRLAEARASLMQVTRIERPSMDDAIMIYPEGRIPANYVSAMSWRIAHSWLSLATSWLGYPDQALSLASTAVGCGRGMPSLVELVDSLVKQVELASLLYEPPMYQNTLDELIELSERCDFSFYEARTAILKGDALARRGEIAAGRAMIREALARYAATGRRGWSNRHYVQLAETYLSAGEAEEALLYLNDALALAEHTGEAWFTAEIKRQMGEAYRQLGNSSTARHYFQIALSTARRQDAKLWELRGTISLARLLRDEGQREEAYKLLSPIYAWFTEGFGTKDLETAKTLLDELAAARRPQ